jgi:hypothetical protein
LVFTNMFIRYMFIWTLYEPILPENMQQ